MTLPPAIPIVFLILGALAIGASELAQLRRPTVILIITTLLALAALWTVRTVLPAAQTIAAWQPVSVFTVPLSFRVDETAWLLALGLLLVLLTAALTWGVYPGQHRPGPRAVALLLTAAALGGIFASNLLTLAMAWGLLDLTFVAALLVRGGSEVGRRAALAIVVNTASTVCVWIAALLIENQQGSLYWHLFNAPEDARAWLMAAAVLRVGLYPFHQWMPVELGKDPDRAVIIFTVPTVAGLALWVRMSIAQALPEESIVPLLAVLSLVVGALLAWFSSQARNGLPFIALCLAGSVGLLAAAGASSAQLTAATLNWMFINASLFIARGLDRRQPYWSIGSLIAFLSLAALPGTLGFIVQQGIVVEVVRQKQWAILLAVIFAQIGMIAAALRLILSPATESAPAQTLRKIVWGLALTCGAVPLLFFALSEKALLALPSTTELLRQLNLIGLLAMFAPLAIGALLAWRRPMIMHGARDGGQSIWGRVLRLDWVNSVLFYLIDRLTGLLRAAAGLFESEGGLLWTVIVIVVVVVVYTAALQ
ncbi:MAG TPA: proton-conducting transporter membrane subunit [Anaerolineae bacterium]|nr:proton-conducting transporter membrane subunit [Anaerolineae bacterium]